MGGSKAQVIGYKYFMGLHVGVCAGPIDSFLQLRAGGRTAWKGEVTQNTQINVKAANLFGGDEKEGGLYGLMDATFGEADQGINDYLQQQQGDQQPAYRGLFNLVWRGGEVSSLTPYIKTWMMQVFRAKKGWVTPLWYEEKSTIEMQVEADVYDDTSYFQGGGTKEITDPNDPDFNPNNPNLTGFNFEQTAPVMGMNPAHIIYQTLTDTDWGMGYPVTSINDIVFRKAADTLFDENFGMCLTWSRQDSIEGFLQEILDTIGGVLVVNPTSGLFELKLMRYDYDADTGMQGTTPLIVFDEDKIKTLDRFQRMSPINLISEVTVTYVNALTGKTHNVTVQNLGMIQSIAGIVSASKTYVGVCNRVLSDRLAQRDLNAMGIPLAQLKITVGRWAYTLTPGDVFLLSYAELGIHRVAFRVGEIDYGQLEDGNISITAVEDVFGLPDSSYLGSQQSQWLAQDPTPKPVAVRKVYETSYREVYRAFVGNVVSEGVDVTVGTGYIEAVGQKPNSSALAFTALTYLGTEDPVDQGTAVWSPHGLLSEALPAQNHSTVQLIAGFDNLSFLSVGEAVLIGNEICKITDVSSTATGSFEVDRGCVDTLPAAWPAGTDVWFYEDVSLFIQSAFMAGESVGVKLITKTSSYVLDPALAPLDTVEVAGRCAMPYPPASLQLNEVLWYDVTSITGALTLEWRHRDRVAEADVLLGAGNASVGPEKGTAYKLQCFDASHNLLAEKLDIAGNAVDVVLNYTGTVTFELSSTRGGIDSWQKYSVSVDYTPPDGTTTSSIVGSTYEDDSYVLDGGGA